MGSLLVVTGPPGAGKSTVASILAGAALRSALVEGDAFFGFLRRGAIEPWLPESSDQNASVTRAAATAAGIYALEGFTTVYDGVLGPWFLQTFAAATGLGQLDYVILMPSADTCVHRVRTRGDHAFTGEAATRRMHAEFAGAPIDARHVLVDPPGRPAEVAERIAAARDAGELSHTVA